MARPIAGSPGRPAHGAIALVGVGAFVTTLAIPAIAALWWLLAAVAVVSCLSATGVRLRRVIPGEGAARGR